jgi:adenosylcobinamide-GDP ribazoletransferase
VVLTAVRGALGFLSLLPVGRDDGAWRAFRSTPLAFPLAGYVVGVLVAVPPAFALLLSLPAPTVALAYLLAVYVVVGINHVDGVADLGDAVVVHGTPDERREVMRDTTVGVGAALAVALAVAGLALGALGLAGTGADALRVAGVVVAVEVGAKLGMAAVVCLGTASHEGLGSEFTTRAESAQLAGPVVVAVPAAVLAWPSPAAAGALAGGPLAAGALLWWAGRRLGGVGGDVIGATNEFGRVLGLHLGMVVWAVV